MKQSALTANTRERSLEVAQAVAYRLVDVEKNRYWATKAAAVAKLPLGREWTPWGWAAGPLAVAVYLDAMDRAFPHNVLENAIIDHVSETASLIENQLQVSAYIDPSMFHGLSGTLLCLNILSRNRSRYTKLESSLANLFFDSLVNIDFKQLSSQQYLPSAAYDLISGAVGIGTVALHLSSDPRWNQISTEIADSLAARILQVPEGEVGNALYSHQTSLPEHHRNHYPNGYQNLGLAHGTAGVIGFLSRFLRIHEANNSTEEVSIALRRLVGLHLRKADLHDGCPYWPMAVDPSNNSTFPVHSFGWCYGSAGHLASLFHASMALEDGDLRAWTIGTASRFIQGDENWPIESPGICHGMSGGILALNLILSFAPSNYEWGSDLGERVDSLLGLFDPEATFGFSNGAEGPVKVPSPGLLEGASGVGMCLLSLSVPVDPLWSAPLFV